MNLRIKKSWGNFPSIHVSSTAELLFASRAVLPASSARASRCQHAGKEGVCRSGHRGRGAAAQSFARSLQSLVPGGVILVICFLKISLRESATDSPKNSADAPTTPSSVTSAREHGVKTDNPE